MGQGLAVEAVEIVEAHRVGHGAALRETQSPLAHHRGPVTRLLQHGSKGLGALSQRILALRVRVQEHSVPAHVIQRHIAFLVIAYLAVPHVLAGEKTAA